MKKTYSILLYYHYTPIEDTLTFSKIHHAYCIKKNLLGRIIIANEGLNGTVSGLKEDCEQYMQWVKADKRFAETDFKITPAEKHAFPKLSVRIKPEIVRADLPHIKPYQKAGRHIDTVLFEKMRKDPETVVVDARSNKEHRLGKIKGAITMDIDYFREFPQKTQTLAHLKKKKIITYCTGGVKCEKFSAYLMEQGFENVYQLKGGIIRYSQESDGSAFEGVCYVFDNRLSVLINKKNPTIISTCHICQQPCERMVNCANPQCNIQVAICHACATSYEGACSQACKKHFAKRDYNGIGYYTKKLNGHNLAQSLHK